MESDPKCLVFGENAGAAEDGGVPALQSAEAVGGAAHSSSRVESMRIKKNFTLQTSLMLREEDTTAYVGSFALGTELRRVHRSPLSC